MKRSGAGGNWKRIDERIDASIVKQTSGLSCVAAVGEMLLESRGISLPQRRIIAIIGEPAYFENLAEVLNSVDVSEGGNRWLGVTVAEKDLDFLLRKYERFAVILREPFEMGHAVLIDGRTKDDLIKIKDPFDQTAYQMTVEDFRKHWNGEVIFYGRINRI